MLTLTRDKKSPARPALDVVPANAKAIITCEACNTDCRVPTDRGTIRVTCPGCGQKGLWSPEEPATLAKPVRPGEGRGYPEEVRIAHTCKAREGVAILTFKRFRLQGKGAYRLHKVETLPRGSGREAIAQAMDRSDVPETFPHDLIDWSEVACPHCHAPATQPVACGNCRAIACMSSVTTHKDGQVLHCLCGAEGPIEIVDVVDLTQTKLGHIREDSGPTCPSSPSDTLRLGYDGRQSPKLLGKR